MDHNGHSAQIFNHALRAKHRARALRRHASGRSEGFLLQKAGLYAADRLLDINRQFETAVIIGLPPFVETLLKSLSTERHPKRVHRYNHWPDVFPDNCDLIVSGLALQSRNDIPDLIRIARQALKPDGFFLSVILGGESLKNLRQACFGADQSRAGGVYPRVAPMITLQQAAGLLSHAGLAQPVIDKDIIDVSYGTLKNMVSDLRDIGESNCRTDQSIKYAGRKFLSEIESNFPERTENGKFVIHYELIWMSGWAPHESQQQPLKPGSAKMKLSDALKKIRD